MPWVEALLRGARVLARANADGSLHVQGGRVQIRYKPKDGRAYRASAHNLAIVSGAPLLADDACAPEPSEPISGPTVRGRAPVSPSGRTGLREGARPARHGGEPEHPASAWVAYTDGACSGNPGPAGCGMVLVSPGGQVHEGYEYLGEATNNVAELTAILRAIEWIPKSARAIVVRTDSQYAIGVLQKGWKAKANQDLVARTKDAVKSRGAILAYVPGHQGVALNERADQLARTAIQTRQSHDERP